MREGEFQDLVSRHRDRIFTFAFYSLKNREDAEDVTQEVLIRLWKHRHRLADDYLTAWILRVTRNACCDVVRRRRVRQGRIEEHAHQPEIDSMPSHDPDPHSHAEAADFRRRLRAALSTLPEPHRSIVVLREIQGLKYDEIAATVGKPLNTIKVYLHRGRKLLREQLREVPAYAKAS
ncbi:MAG: RNA polymerase sigma factor [bacterium]|nr:RNA polymerase sigma factor [bacterium]